MPTFFAEEAASPSEAPFQRKEKKPVNGFPIATMFRKSSVEGDIGIELEFEGSNLPKKDDPENPWGSFKSSLIPKEWDYHHDGSLRGKNGNAEYVLKKPCKFDELEDRLDDLWDMFEKAETQMEESNRTSVHIHLNAQTWHLNRITSFLGIYFCLEDILTKWCGEHRVGNLFCLRGRDATGIVQHLKKFIKSDGDSNYLIDGLHYAGLNCHALVKFGSIEVRSLRGVTDKQTVLDWVSILRRLYDLSGSFEDPRSVCSEFSGSGAFDFLETLLGDNTNTVLNGCGMDNQEIIQSMHDGIRLAQDICYCRDWSLYKPVEINPDPFGRNPRTVQNQIEAYSSENSNSLSNGFVPPTFNSINMNEHYETALNDLVPFIEEIPY